MKSPDLDAIIASVPTNATAARVTAKGDTWKPSAKMPPGYLHWDTQPLLKPFGGPPEHDMTGKRFGKFTVVGALADAGGKNRGPRWVCRCSCGHFEARQTNAIKVALAGLVEITTVSPAYSCWECSSFAVAKGRYAKKGAAPLSQFTEPQAPVDSRSPQEIIAESMSVDASAAMKAISALQSAGFRIVRGQH